MTTTGRGTVEAPGTLVQKRANENRWLLKASPRIIRTMLKYKAPWYGSRIVVVDPAHLAVLQPLRGPSMRPASSAVPASSALDAAASSMPTLMPRTTS